MVGGRAKFKIFFVGVFNNVMCCANLGFYGFPGGWIRVFMHIIDLHMAAPGKHRPISWRNRIKVKLALEKIAQIFWALFYRDFVV